MLHFYPGPSKVYPQVSDWMQEANTNGILSLQHRSEEFMDIYRTIKKLMVEKYRVPDDYTLLFASSATECWHILSDAFQSLESHHFYNGSFGKKFYDYRRQYKAKNAFAHPFGLEDELCLETLSKVSDKSLLEPRIICLTQNETSNGTQIEATHLSDLRIAFANDFVFVDATSSFGAVDATWTDADIWYASVQKCLGLPAGLAVMLVSPNVIDFYQSHIRQADSENTPRRYNDLGFLLDKAADFQTTYTPNVLNIYLLSKVLNFVPSLETTSKRIRERSQRLYAHFEENDYHLLIKDPSIRSDTVICLRKSGKATRELLQKTDEKEIILGKGYGKWKENTIRIANFPQHQDEEYEWILT